MMEKNNIAFLFAGFMIGLAVAAGVWHIKIQSPQDDQEKVYLGQQHYKLQTLEHMEMFKILKTYEPKLRLGEIGFTKAALDNPRSFDDFCAKNNMTTDSLLSLVHQAIVNPDNRIKGDSYWMSLDEIKNILLGEAKLKIDNQGYNSYIQGYMDGQQHILDSQEEIVTH